MHLFTESRMDLRRLILLLAVTTAVLTLLNTVYASYRIQRDLLTRQTLEVNRIHAAKLAESTEGLLASARQQLAYSASRLAPLLGQPRLLAAEAERLRLQTDSFNATFVVDTDRIPIALSPSSRAAMGQRIDSPDAHLSLDPFQPQVSRTFVTSSERLAVVITHPFHAGDGRHLGFVGGTIHLREPNALAGLLDEHDGAYLYVIDQHGQILYHPEPERIGEYMAANPATAAVVRSEHGSQALHDGNGDSMLAGYAPVPSTGWGIVALRPQETTLMELHALMLGLLANAAPLSLLTLLGLCWLSRRIAQPLRQLADSARQLDSPAGGERLRQIHAWYFEAQEIRHALLIGQAQLNLKLGRLDLDATVDPLTGLLNRHGLQLALRQWQQSEQPYAVIAIDIDHFKLVNDRFGHDVGDQLLRHLAQLMQQIARQADVLCRRDGEEFVMLLPRTTLVDACGVAERLRQCVADSPSPDGTAVTISLGVAYCPDSRNDADGVLMRADQALHAAKNQGRNRVVIAGTV